HTVNREIVVWEMDKWTPRAELAGRPVRVTRETATTVELSTDHPAGGVLELRESYDEGWRARIDGKESAISRSINGFRNISVPAGKHIVEFRYRPLSFPIGLIISFGAILAFVMTGWKARR